ncbi:photosynthetic NDH subunit of subcomplex B 3, chloroplastic [Abrus precatorius]|uniref:Photosynthetic NDH subunit of subcomplex B 3, chloroplastic n=1 Tax=Abrus precatorius TaxID=3816 RepID=A0A8B8KI48_ABRPR|nr:photosynthetic NDH subunit of subcomplex B 3, chloroplastic [Abrus precatorius]
MSLLQLQLTSHALCSISPSSHCFRPLQLSKPLQFSKRLRFVRTKIKAVGTVPEKDSDSETNDSNDPPFVGFVFVSPVLLPDGTPDLHYRSACGGRKLRNIMMDSNIDLYGPYARALLNCGGGGTCGTCVVEVLEGMELLSPRTNKEKEKLKKNPKNWRLACQTTVGTPDSRGAVVIQQLPEWKGHEWKYDKPGESEWESESS